MMKRFVSTPTNAIRTGTSIVYIAGIAVLLGAPFGVLMMSVFICAPLTNWLCDVADRERPPHR